MRILFDPRAVLTFIGSTTGKAWLKSTLIALQQKGGKTRIHAKLNGDPQLWTIRTGWFSQVSVAKALDPGAWGLARWWRVRLHKMPRPCGLWSCQPG